MSIQDALNSEDDIIKILAILDKRIGKRTLQKIKETEEYKKYPEWVRQFYELRLARTVNVKHHRKCHQQPLFRAIPMITDPKSSAKRTLEFP